MYKLVILSACVALAFGGLVKRETPASSETEQLKKNIEALGETLKSKADELVNSKTTQEFQQTVKEGSDALLQQLSTFSASIQAALKDGSAKAQETLQQTAADIKKTVDELRKNHPEVEQNAQAIQTQYKEVARKTAEASKKLVDEIVKTAETANAQVAPQLKEAVDQFTKGAETIQKQIHDAATKQ